MWEIGCFLHACQGSSLQPGQVPLPGIESATFWCTEWPTEPYWPGLKLASLEANRHLGDFKICQSINFLYCLRGIRYGFWLLAAGILTDSGHSCSEKEMSPFWCMKPRPVGSFFRNYETNNKNNQFPAANNLKATTECRAAGRNWTWFHFRWLLA